MFPSKTQSIECQTLISQLVTLLGFGITSNNPSCGERALEGKSLINRRRWGEIFLLLRQCVKCVIRIV